ncbi:MAG: imidazole glycerol phosphate synthase subunit HisH [Deltaproteobacteria bacterium]|nr:imidazole glycerol phosphate synthase subunit HisH [Deltaproteobacteria bacterium]
MIAIIDYEAGNQTSVRRAFDFLRTPAVITSQPRELWAAQGVVFPGVGAAGQAMERLKKTGLDQEIAALVAAGRPFLGVCLGCQIMLERSEENATTTLGLLPGQTVRFDPQTLDQDRQPIRVPHMGWNEVQLVKPTCLWEGIGPLDQFYFVHSYYPAPASDLTLGLTEHGHKFAAFLGRDGLWAVQFHPEKSGPPGLRLLKNFAAYCQKKAHAE